MIFNYIFFHIHTKEKKSTFVIYFIAQRLFLFDKSFISQKQQQQQKNNNNKTTTTTKTNKKKKKKTKKKGKPNDSIWRLQRVLRGINWLMSPIRQRQLKTRVLWFLFRLHIGTVWSVSEYLSYTSQVLYKVHNVHNSACPASVHNWSQALQTQYVFWCHTELS